MTTTRTKVAILPFPMPGFTDTVGSPAPCYLNCPCGAKPRLPTGRTDPDWDYVECACGRVYDSLGWIQVQETK